MIARIKNNEKMRGRRGRYLKGETEKNYRFHKRPTHKALFPDARPSGINRYRQHQDEVHRRNWLLLLSLAGVAAILLIVLLTI